MNICRLRRTNVVKHDLEFRTYNKMKDDYRGQLSSVYALSSNVRNLIRI